MRTRSQPISPGGFLSLEKEKDAPRQTRSMRARSTSHTSAQSNSQSDNEEPQAQPTTRSRTNKKTTTTKNTGAKKGTTTKKTTTTRKTATTKRAAAARKTDTTAQPPSKPTKAPATRAMKTRAGQKTNGRTVEQSPEEESQETHDASQSPEVKAEVDTTANEFPKIPDENNGESQNSTEVTSSAVDVLSEPQASDCESQPFQPTPTLTLESQGPEEHKDEFNDFDVTFLPLKLKKFSDLGSPLSELSQIPSIDGDDAFQVISQELNAAIAAEEQKLGLVSPPATPSRANFPDSSQTGGLLDSLKLFSTEGGPLQLAQPLEWSDAVDALTLSLGNLRLTDPIVDVMATPVMAFIYATEPPVMPALPVLDSVRQSVVESPGRCVPFLGASDLFTQTSIYEDGCASPSMAPIVRPSVEEPQFRSATRSARLCFPTPLSPIPKESERVKLEVPSPVEALTVSPGCMQKADITSLEPRPHLSSSPNSPLSKKAPKEKRQLTPTIVNRKRPRVDSPDRVSETPSVKRTRTLRPPGSTSLARRLAPLSRRLSTNGMPYAERLRRRQAERQGRIHTTVFRLPELVAQTEADRRASESASPSPAPPAPHNSFDFPESSEPSRSIEESTPQEPRTPETPRGWNIRGLLNSVPRFSVSRFLPRLGRSFGRTEEGEEIDPDTASRQSTPSAPSTPTKTTAAPAQPPGTERVVTTEQWKAPGRSTPKYAPAKKPLPNLSYDLFPRPINRDLYLPRSPEPAAEARDAAEGGAANKEQPQEQEKQAQASSESAATSAEERGREATEITDKKRKRASSPDVIPNPPGCSYGLDLDYFCYSDSDGEEEPSPSISKPTPLAKSAVRSTLRSESHPSKKVRFDASPEDTPSKKRGRATDPYQGHHFLGLGDVSPTPATDSAKTAPATPTATGSPTQRPHGFKFNSQGSFGFDYDDLSDDSSSSGASTPAILSPANTLPETHATPRSQVQESLQSPRPTPRAAPFAPPSTPNIDAEALAKVRSQAEKYKPKTPSGLRTASRYSTSPMVQSPHVESFKKPEPKDVIPECPEKENVPEKPIEKSAEKFGDDQFARDAEWLYERCPSGDFSKFTWPEKRNLVDSLEINPEAVKILDNVWDPSDIEVGHSTFRRGMEEFAATLV